MKLKYLSLALFAFLFSACNNMNKEEATSSPEQSTEQTQPANDTSTTNEQDSNTANQVQPESNN